MNEFKEETQAFSVKIPISLWRFLKRESADQDMSMQRIINACLKQYKAKREKKKIDPQY